MTKIFFHDFFADNLDLAQMRACGTSRTTGKCEPTTTTNDRQSGVEKWSIFHKTQLLNNVRIFWVFFSEPVMDSPSQILVTVSESVLEWSKKSFRQNSRLLLQIFLKNQIRGFVDLGTFHINNFKVLVRISDRLLTL